MADKLSRMGISPDPQTGHLIVVYLDEQGQKQTLDLTDAIDGIAAEKVKQHERNYHGG